MGQKAIITLVNHVYIAVLAKEGYSQRKTAVRVVEKILVRNRGYHFISDKKEQAL